MTKGYYRFPTISGETVVFVCEDDLWTVSTKGGTARRLTSNLGEVSRPFLSPDGSVLAYTGRDEGDAEVYVMPALGGGAKRLTYHGGVYGGIVVGWDPDGKFILYASSYGQPFLGALRLWKISPQGGPPEMLPFGPARNISYGPHGGVVLGRNTADPARWKRYRGGTAGDLWIDPDGRGRFRRLVSLKGNLGSPMWMGNRIYFLSDHEGIGNLYSCIPLGEDLRRHTHHEEYYVRNPTTDGKRIVYHAGADLYLYDPQTDEDYQIPIEFYSPQVQRNRRFVDAPRYIQAYDLHPEGHSIAITTRGRPFTMALWEGAVTQFGVRDGVRYRLTRWTSDGTGLIAVSDADGEEALELHLVDKKIEPKRFGDLDIGRPLNLYVSPRKDRNQVVFSNHRHELLLVDLKEGTLRKLDHSPFRRIAGIAWSPDGQWVAYGYFTSAYTSCIKLYKMETGETFRITQPDFVDTTPAFDPEGKYLYFLSARVYDPVYDNIYFDLNFPKGMRPYLITLQSDLKSPFIPEPRAPGQPKPKEMPKEPQAEDASASQGNKKEGEKKEDKKPDEIKPIRIDLEGIQNRIVAFPVPEGLYGQIVGISGKALFTSFPAEGSLERTWWESGEPPAKGNLESYDFEEQKRDTLVVGVTEFKLSLQGKALIYRAGNRLRVWKAGDKIDESQAKNGYSRKSGWLDLSRIKISVTPPTEWRQMYREAWRLQREHFWVSNMAGVDWEHVYRRYLPLIDRLCTRSEVSDLMWEMQGELGTSHAYEMGGDYRPSPFYRLGSLGADLSFDAETGMWKIVHIVRGDSWDERWDSPLNAPGVNAKEGDVILAMGGYLVGRDVSPYELLVNQAGQYITLILASADGTNTRNVTVKTLDSDISARYREWVETNRKKVHEATHGRIGYVHIPNMGPLGYAEFHRYYHAEVQCEGLIVDVRFNGGGHVSQLILEKLARKRLGYNIQRWGQPTSYPAYAVLGPMVALTNELAGSDGDIFSHSFKLMKLGPLIGKRTWGGVIGIWPRHALVDGTVTTQPEFSFWFTDVEWGVENYGTDPDIEVDITPQDYVAGKDPQMEKALAVILQQLEENPPRLPEFNNWPNLAWPKLPR
jgi:tricorn protease